MNSSNSKTHRRVIQIVTGLLFTIVAVQPDLSNAQTKGWTWDVKAAMEQATAEKKDLLMNFTGSDWCHYCIEMRREVFVRETFQATVNEHFVLVEFDFPNDRSRLTEKTQLQNALWKRKLKVRGFPSVFLTDAKGIPYAQTGYQKGGAEQCIERLNELRTVRTRRDELLANAELADGIERAKLIDEALREVFYALDLNIAFSVYATHVEEIIRLDAQNEAGLGNKYKETLAVVTIRQLEQELGPLVHQQGPKAAMAKIEEVRQRFEPEGKLALNLGLLEAQVFAQNNQFDEALVVFDNLLESAQEDSEKGMVYAFKANFFSHFKKNEVALQAVDAALTLVSDQNLKRRLENLKQSLGGASNPLEEN